MTTTKELLEEVVLDVDMDAAVNGKSDGANIRRRRVFRTSRMSFLEKTLIRLLIDFARMRRNIYEVIAFIPVAQSGQRIASNGTISLRTEVGLTSMQ